MTNKSHKNTIVILYPPGGYGTFLHWAIEYFSGALPVRSRPFELNGSAHLFQGVTLDRTQSEFTTAQYLHSDKQYAVVRTHGWGPHSVDHAETKFYAQNYGACFNKIINIVQTAECYLLLLHNRLTKNSRNSYSLYFDQVIQKYQSQFCAKLPVPQWQLREMLSYKHEHDLYYVEEYYQPLLHTNIVNLNVSDLVTDFDQTLTQLFLTLGLTMSRQSELASINAEWLKLQKFKAVDQLCQDIVQSVLGTGSLVWQASDLTVIDEAYVQYLLRKQGIEMRCFGLDTFPTDVVQLRSYLYHK